MNNNESIINSFEDYRKAKGVNWSILKHFFKSPAHVKESLDNPSPESDAMRLGKLQHMALLEPEKLKDTCIAAPEFGSLRKNDADGTTTEQGKINREAKSAFYEANADRTIIPASDYNALIGMSKAVYANDDAKALLQDVVATEKAIFWKDPITGVECKGLLDLITAGGALVDVKTAADCRYHIFQTKAAQLNYYGQMSYYLRGAKELGLDLKVAVWIVVENTAPYAVRCYRLTELDEQNCNDLIDAFLRRWKVCTDQDFWPAYTEDLQSLDAPEWYVKQLKNAL